MNWLDEMEARDPAYNGKGWFGNEEEDRNREKEKKGPEIKDETEEIEILRKAG